MAPKSIALLLNTPHMEQDEIFSLPLTSKVCSKVVPKRELYGYTLCSTSIFLQKSSTILRASSLYPGIPSSTVMAFSVKLCSNEISFNICNNERESFPPDTATPTTSPDFIMLYLDIVFVVLCTIDLEKQLEQRFSPEYFLEYTTVFSQRSHFMIQFTF